MKKINVDEIASRITEYFSPKIIAEVDDHYVKIAKIRGDKVPWHSHEHEDELFYILKGMLTMEVKGQAPFQMTEGDLFVVPKGINHRIYSDEECTIMLIERKSTRHTGELTTDITKSIAEQKK
jgi:mannose-6-phosphate isomerase-like protein (cupin superfamily)